MRLIGSILKFEFMIAKENQTKLVASTANPELSHAFSARSFLIENPGALPPVTNGDAPLALTDPVAIQSAWHSGLGQRLQLMMRNNVCPNDLRHSLPPGLT